MTPNRIIYLTLPHDYISGSPHKKLSHHVYRCSANVGTALSDVYHSSVIGQFHQVHGVNLDAALYLDDDDNALTTVPDGDGPMRINMVPSLILLWGKVSLHYLYRPTYHQVQVDGDHQHVNIRLYHEERELGRDEMVVDDVDGETIVDLKGAFYITPPVTQKQWKKILRRICKT